jgi:hypothetical protein
MPGRWTGSRPKFEGRTWSNRLAQELDELVVRLFDGLANLQGFPGTPTDAGAGDSGSAGTGSKPALEDHTHAHPTVTPEDVGLTSAEGTDDTFVRGDHVHGIPGWLPRWTKYTVGHAALQAAALTNDIELFSLPAKAMLHEVHVKHSTAFAGTGITAYTVSVGIAGETTRYSDAFDVFQAVGDTVFDPNAGGFLEDHGSATSVRIFATSEGANLDQSSAGSVDVWVLWSTLP